MPCGARLEVVQSVVDREGDVHVSDHVDCEVRILPVLPPEQLDGIFREELEKLGWTREPDGSMSKVFGDDAIATLPVGQSTIRLAGSKETTVSIRSTTTERITEGDVAAREEVARRAQEQGDRKLEAAQEAAHNKLVKETAERLLGHLGDLKGDISNATNATTKRALEQRANELGAIDSVREGRASDGSYELSITVRT